MRVVPCLTASRGNTAIVQRNIKGLPMQASKATVPAAAVSAALATTATPAAAPKPGVPAANRTITLLVPGNPKKPGSASAARFALYKPGMGTAAYAAAVKASGQPARLAAADLLWDVRHGFIKLA